MSRPMDNPMRSCSVEKGGRYSVVLFLFGRTIAVTGLPSKKRADCCSASWSAHFDSNWENLLEAHAKSMELFVASLRKRGVSEEAIMGAVADIGGRVVGG